MISVIREAKRPERGHSRLLVSLGGRTWLTYESNFILFWGETRTIPTGAGPILQGFGLPAWFLAQWHEPAEYGPPTLWDYDLLGPYPSRGAYEIVQPFYRRWADGRFDSMPMNYRTLEALIPLIFRYRSDNLAHRRQVLEDDREQQWKETENQIADRLHDAFPLGEILSYRLQGSRNSAVRQRMLKIEQDAKWFSAMPQGMAAINPLQHGLPLPKKLQHA